VNSPNWRKEGGRGATGSVHPREQKDIMLSILANSAHS